MQTFILFKFIFHYISHNLDWKWDWTIRQKIKRERIKQMIMMIIQIKSLFHTFFLSSHIIYVIRWIFWNFTFYLFVKKYWVLLFIIILLAVNLVAKKSFCFRCLMLIINLNKWKQQQEQLKVITKKNEFNARSKHLW